MGIIKVGVIVKNNKNMVLAVGLASLICFSSNATLSDEESSSAFNVISWGCFLPSLFSGIDGLNKLRKNAEETEKTFSTIVSGICYVKNNPEESIQNVIDAGLNIGEITLKILLFPFRCAWTTVWHPIRTGQGVIGAGRATVSSFRRICNNLAQKRRQSVETVDQSN